MWGRGVCLCIRKTRTIDHHHDTTTRFAPTAHKHVHMHASTSPPSPTKKAHRCKSCGVGRGSSWRDLKEARCARISARGGTSCFGVCCCCFCFCLCLGDGGGGWSGQVPDANSSLAPHTKRRTLNMTTEVHVWIDSPTHTHPLVHPIKPTTHPLIQIHQANNPPTYRIHQAKSPPTHPPVHPIKPTTQLPCHPPCAPASCAAGAGRPPRSGAGPRAPTGGRPPA